MKLLQTTTTSVALATAFIIGIVGRVDGATLAGNSSSTLSPSAMVSSAYTNTVSSDLATQLQAILDKTVRETGIPGAVVGIVSPQGTWYGASGVSNRETGKAMQLNNLFHTGSIRKAFIAATVLKVQEQGKLSLDDTLDKWVPEIAKEIPDGNTITIRQLLNGTSGIKPVEEDFEQDIIKDPSILLTKDWQPEDTLTYVYGKPRFTGQKCTSVWCYPTTGVTIAQQIVEKATGSTFSSVFRDRVVEPLGLNHTFLGGVDEIPAQLVRGYTDLNGDGNLTDVTDYDLAFSKALGGVVTTNAQDLMRFTQGLFGGELLKGESLSEMLTFVDTGLTFNPYGEEFRYQFGLGVDNFPSPWGATLGKGGTNVGNEAEMRYFADRGIAAVALINGTNIKGVSISDILYTHVNTLLANSQGNNSQSVPESSATGGLIALGAVGLLFVRQRR
ncbi:MULTISPECIES: serine hydrolase domain-containing protein [Nostocales]|uniref:Beta-lactamase family protein n=3 Tax=Nostocales TaxID=1161 RepID=A0A8S9T6C9_9CYAN|nr:serine hydrolase domain-containing protein [Tolypothrix bouteillei]KAF3886983.1 beta-lactamase family protein [Tolypothrix bouteillei VB521301]